MAVTHRRIAAPGTRPRRLRAGQAWMHVVLLILLALTLYPILLVVFDSLKTPLQYQYERWGVSLPIRLDNYTNAWGQVGVFMLNTTIVAATTTVGILALSLVGGYVFARLRFPFREPLYYVIIALLMIPAILSFVPQYVMYKNFGLLDNLLVLIVPGIAGGQVFGIFLLRTFIANLPDELYDAAAVDGAGWYSLIFRITLPLTLPVLAVLTVFNVVGQWNSFLWPLVAITNSSSQVISVGLFGLQQQVAQDATNYGNYGPLYAGYIIASVPLVILFVFLGKFYVEGLVSSGLKL